jgi:hypothetical protein
MRNTFYSVNCEQRIFNFFVPKAGLESTYGVGLTTE